MNLNNHYFQRKPVPVVFLTIMCNVSDNDDLIFKIPKGIWSWRKRIQGKAERALSGGTPSPSPQYSPWRPISIFRRVIFSPVIFSPAIVIFSPVIVISALAT